jgi:hypothetical protein
MGCLSGLDSRYHEAVWKPSICQVVMSWTVEVLVDGDVVAWLGHIFVAFLFARLTYQLTASCTGRVRQQRKKDGTRDPKQSYRTIYRMVLPTPHSPKVVVRKTTAFNEDNLIRHVITQTLNQSEVD